MTASVSVVIVTADRPEHLRTCLQHIEKLVPAPLEVVVVDDSSDDRMSRSLSDEFPDVRFVRHKSDSGPTPEPRHTGYAATSGDIVAFIGDDAHVDERWLGELTVPYADPRVVAVCGRVLHGIEGEAIKGRGEIGRLLPDGRLTDNFAADPGRQIDVDHQGAANMSFRRTALDAIGGIRGGYPGTGHAAESDISLRLGLTGGKLVLQPTAIVTQTATRDMLRRKRLDRRHIYYARRNHVVLLVRLFGWRDPLLTRYIWSALRDQPRHFSRLRSELRARTRQDTRLSPLQRLRVFAGPTLILTEARGLISGVFAALGARRDDRRAHHGR